MKRIALVVACALLSLGADCCDPNHDGYAQAAESVKLCIARGGIPIAEPFLDNGGHKFQILKQCAFPCDQRIAVEKD